MRLIFRTAVDLLQTGCGCKAFNCSSKSISDAFDTAVRKAAFALKIPIVKAPIAQLSSTMIVYH